MPVPIPYRHAFVTVAALVLAGSISHADAADKVDRALRDALKTSAATQSVIISVNPGCRAGIRQAIEQHGDVVRSEHTIIDALSAQIHSADIDVFAKSSCVKAV